MGIAAASGMSVPAGSKAGLISLVTETNKCFDEMVGDLFPRTNRAILAPYHVGVGRIEVKDSGILSLSERDIGTIQVFYDINNAEADGHFGPDPVIWKEQDMHVALEMLADALDLEGKAWEEHVHHPTKWSDEGIPGTKPSDSQMDGA